MTATVVPFPGSRRPRRDERWANYKTDALRWLTDRGVPRDEAEMTATESADALFGVGRPCSDKIWTGTITI